jgi:hypothetical protein
VNPENRSRPTATPIAQALDLIEQRLGGAGDKQGPLVEVYGAVGALGPALAARLARAGEVAHAHRPKVAPTKLGSERSHRGRGREPWVPI